MSPPCPRRPWLSPGPSQCFAARAAPRTPARGLRQPLPLPALRGASPRPRPAPSSGSSPREGSSPPASGNPPPRDRQPSPGVLAPRLWEGHLHPPRHPLPHFRGFHWDFLPDRPRVHTGGGQRSGLPPRRPHQPPLCSHVHPTPSTAYSHLSGHAHASRTHRTPRGLLGARRPNRAARPLPAPWFRGSAHRPKSAMG